METLQEALLRLEPRIDLLHDCLGFGRFAEAGIHTADSNIVRSPVVIFILKRRFQGSWMRRGQHGQ